MLRLVSSLKCKDSKDKPAMFEESFKFTGKDLTKLSIMMIIATLLFGYWPANDAFTSVAYEAVAALNLLISMELATLVLRVWR